MNSMKESVQRYLAIALMLVLPGFAWGQKKTNPPAPKAAPAPHASAPAHTSAPAQHSNAPTQHSNAPGPGAGPANRGGNSNMGHGNATTTGHGNTPNSTMGHGNATTNGRPGATANGRPGAGANAMGHTNAGGPGAARGNASAHVAPGRQVSLRGGGSASIRPNGQIRSVNRNGMQINHGLHGGRTVVSTHNGARVVSVGHRGGYVQRAYVVRGGHSYYSRTYYYHGEYRAGVYRGYYYGGRPYYGYYPAYYYRPVYYGWAYNPWPAPVYYGWGWGGSPWYGYYGPYYQPYPVYPSAAFWVTDFMIAASLQAAYEAQATAWLGPDASDGGTLVASLMPIPAAETAKLSPEVKQALSDEVKATIAVEQAEAGKTGGSSAAGGSQPATSNEAPPALDPKFRTFMVSSDMSLVVGDGDECPLSQGDVIERTTETPDDDGNVNVKVVASTKSNCAVGKEGPVSTDDLQEMYNSFREGLKDGMAELAKKNGTGGLPKAPDTTTTNGDVPAPPPDKSAQKTLQEQQSAADQAESEVKQEAGSGGGSQ
ncbi:MAG TPA: hypothetical protein VFO46_25585 [Candidatus Sulfotelmatobacter sp.]|nr:hypothetical protein [Candidatus Sulfotelmatobacter sp.]